MYNLTEESDELKLILPKEVNHIIDIITSYGFEAFAVGGCIRDLILGKEPNDWDITTSALPENIIEIFKDYNKTTNGLKHGTVGIVFEHNLYEITTYRIDGDYSDNRHPNSVVFSKSIKEDLLRRDFTINALAYNEKVGLVDVSTGVEDIENKIIKCVGTPDNRFKEDALRILRALRFSSTLGFNIEKNTSISIFNNVNLLDTISKERVSIELTKLLIGNNCGEILRLYHNIIFYIIPNLKPMFEYNQNTPYHNLDLWEHTVTAVENAEQTALLRTVMLLHDVGKINTRTTDKKGISHYHNHAIESEKIAIKVLKELKYSNKFIDRVALLIRYHDYFCTPTKKSVKKLLSKIGIDNAFLLVEVQKADSSAKADFAQQSEHIRITEFLKILNEIKENDECFSINDLKINGNDIMKLGVPSGKKIGLILNDLLLNVVNNSIKNEREELLLEVEKLISET